MITGARTGGRHLLDAATNEYLHARDVRAQTRQTLKNVEAILAAGGAVQEDTGVAVLGTQGVLLCRRCRQDTRAVIGDHP